jgi:hypothetical protein
MRNYFAVFQDNSGNVPFQESGSGFFLNLISEFKNLDFMISYWYGDEFEAPLGGDIYQSVSRKIGETPMLFSSRQLLFFRLLYHQELVQDLNLGIRVEPVLDVEESLFDYSFGLYVAFNTELLLHTFKQQN